MLAALLCNQRRPARVAPGGGEPYSGPRGPTGLPATEWPQPQRMVERLAASDLAPAVMEAVAPHARNRLRDVRREALELPRPAVMDVDYEALQMDLAAVARLQRLYRLLLDDEALVLLLLQ